jgi:hypothetical protein
MYLRDKAIISLLKDKSPQLTMGCKKDGHCHFEFWAGEIESFFCDLKDCHFSQGSD